MAVVVLKNEVFNDAERLTRVARKLNDARKIMFEFDPLQHHSWQVLTEKDLMDYPEAYFPAKLFEYSKTLFYDKKNTLTYYHRKEQLDFLKSFLHLSESIIWKLENKRFPNNIYQLKSLLSEFMLLPSFYVQARDKQSIYKKNSFDEARKDFSARQWEIMNIVSEIRQQWDYDISRWQYKIMTQPNPWARHFVRHFAPPVPQKINRLLFPKTYETMKKLALSMQHKLMK